MLKFIGQWLSLNNKFCIIIINRNWLSSKICFLIMLIQCHENHSFLVYIIFKNNFKNWYLPVLISIGLLDIRGWYSFKSFLGFDFDIIMIFCPFITINWQYKVGEGTHYFFFIIYNTYINIYRVYLYIMSLYARFFV